MDLRISTLIAKELEYNFYKIIGLHCPDRGEILACAARRDGFAALPSPGQEAPAMWLRPEGVDFVDVSALDPDHHPFAVAALGADCSIHFVRDLLTDHATETLHLNLSGEGAYQVFCFDGHILLLTNQRLYVFKNLATRFLEGEPIGGVLSPSWLELEAVSASLTRDRSLLVVMPDSVLRIELDSLIAPASEWANQSPARPGTGNLMMTSCDLGPVVGSQESLNSVDWVFVSSSASEIFAA